jgi:cupin superfamily acireductone dioxygenase involved in methionine salvage
MQAKMYPIDKVESVETEIAAAPALPPKLLTQEQVLKRLAKEIKRLHTAKNYSATEIVALLKKSGIKATAREVKNIIEKTTKKPEQKARKKMSEIANSIGLKTA